MRLFINQKMFKLACFSVISILSSVGNTAPVSSTEDWERREILVDENSLANIQLSVEQGRWSNDGFKGALNYVITSHSNGANKLYVQWLNEEGEVAYTVSIREFNIAPEYKLELPVCLSNDCNLSKIEAEHVYEEVEQTFVLNLVGLGRYSVGLFKQ